MLPHDASLQLLFLNQNRGEEALDGLSVVFHVFAFALQKLVQMKDFFILLFDQTLHWIALNNLSRNLLIKNDVIFSLFGRLVEVGLVRHAVEIVGYFVLLLATLLNGLLN